MPRRPRAKTTSGDTHATCPECGASVPVVRVRWLNVHTVGSAEYTFQTGTFNRCPGSLMPVKLSPRVGV